MSNNTKSFNKDNNSSKFTVKMKAETAGKIGLFSAIMIILGAMIGIGIFLKNGGVFRNNNGNPYGVLSSWIIVILIAICTAYSFGEISRIKTETNAGLGGWSSRYIGNRFGRFVRLTYPLMYYSIVTFSITTILAELIFKVKYGEQNIPNDINFWYIILVSFGVTILLVLFNYFCENILIKLTSVLGIIKFIPIILFSIGAIVAFAMNIGNNMFIPGEHVSPTGEKTYSGEFSIFGVFDSLPAIMFALDGFLIVGNISGKINNPIRNVPIVIIVSMIISCVIYLFVTITQILSCCPNIYELFVALFGNESKVKDILTYILSGFMIIALVNASLSLSFATMKSFEYSIDQDLLFSSKWLKRKLNGNKKFAALIYLFILQIFYFLSISIISGVLQTDIFIDGTSNVIVVMMFFVYGFVALSSAINHFTKKIPQSEVQYQKGQIVTCIISFIGCIFIPCWTLGWTFLGDPISNANSNFNGWGLFYGDTNIKKWIVAIVFWSISILLIGMPFFNDLLIKLTDKNYNQPLLWQKLNKNNKIVSTIK